MTMNDRKQMKHDSKEKEEQTTGAVDPKYGIPKRQKFVAFRDGGPARKSAKKNTTASPLAQHLAKVHERVRRKNIHPCNDY